MPLVRVEVRSAYALGEPELYRQVNKEDPKEILEGIAVSGLVGVLRQLGDLAEFAAEVFHGLQDDVMRTSSRSHRLMARVQNIESALAPLEKAVLAQRSHLHFAYTAGSDWHARIQCQENHFLCNDLPQFIMDSYEGCRGSPHLHLLDRFDPGGPGSCLKRYSDPTLFKRASIASGEASVAEDKHSRKTKKLKQKRRSNPRIREESRGASFFNHGGRNQFTQLNVGRNFTSHMMCSSEDILTSDIGEKSKIDLRNGSCYTENDFCSDNSIQHEELESRESISSPAKRHDSDLQHHNSLEQNGTDTYEDSQTSSSRDQPNCNLSYVTWNEKTDTFESTRQEYDASDMTVEFDHDRNTVSCSSKLNVKLWGVNEVNMETVDENDVIPCDEAVPTLEAGDMLVEDIDSDADQFMDALNTIESEFETDTNCTKEKEGRYSDLDDVGTNDRVGDLISSNLEYQSLESESNVLDCPTITVGCGQDPRSGSPKSPSTAYSSLSGGTVMTELADDKNLQSVLRPGESLDRGGLQKGDPFKKVDIDYNAVERCVANTIVSDSTEDVSGLPIMDRLRCSPESQKPAPETSNVTSVMFWTNGGLLGLEPSKPPDYSLPNALPQDPSFMNDEKNRKTSCNIPPADSKTRHGNTRNSIYQSNHNSTVASTSRSLPPGNIEYQVSRDQQDDSTSSSRIYELSSKLFPMGFNGNLLHDRNDSISPATYYQTTGAFDQKNNQKVAHQTSSGPSKDLIGGEPSVLSPSASPPLEHMKISFQPIDGFETSKLKLEFLYGNSNNESNRCIFPSFQLVPEVSGTLQNDSPDSDDDTFYRSSPSSEDGCISHQSESISDTWESGESPCGKEHDFLQSGLHESDVEQEDSRQKGSVDKKEDFLQQIRARSFSLRPTMTTKPFVQSFGHANIEVTAILRKANAVRQAVGSDDDGNWSDP
ncbi:hypothetical protein F511_15464 [Dorcoceras hygrometricum]|uniref:Protein SCAR n=1 Tax=Dorcoceras hygrometricum TaxID=472368 RepID=A0A2Z7AFG4_9LAMI|nr:hypothetical protein F511_15464 [Dorcoceras hygrometricum]